MAGRRRQGLAADRARGGFLGFSLSCRCCLGRAWSSDSGSSSLSTTRGCSRCLWVQQKQASSVWTSRNLTLKKFTWALNLIILWLYLRVGGVRLLLLLFNYFIKPCVTFNRRNKAFFMKNLPCYCCMLHTCYIVFFLTDPSIAEFLMKKNKKKNKLNLPYATLRSDHRFNSHISLNI